MTTTWQNVIESARARGEEPELAAVVEAALAPYLDGRIKVPNSAAGRAIVGNEVARAISAFDPAMHDVEVMVRPEPGADGGIVIEISTRMATDVTDLGDAPANPFDRGQRAEA